MTETMTRSERRSVEILDRVRAVFAEQGFDGASMQALAAAAGMSAGNFYRYFPSKDAIIEALVRRDLREVEAEFSRITADPDPRRALYAALRRHLEDADPDEGPCWAEIEAAAGRRPEVAAKLRMMERGIEEKLSLVFAASCGLDAREAASLFAPHAHIIFTLIRGLMKESGTAPLSPDVLDLCIGTIDHLFERAARRGGAA